MNKLLTTITLLCFSVAANGQERDISEIIEECSFRDAVNARDAKAWAAELNYPYMRLTDGQIRIWNTPEEWESFAVERFSSMDDLGMSSVQIVSREVTLVGDDKIHIFTENERRTEDNDVIARFQMLTICTKVDGRWGAQVVSHNAPPLNYCFNTAERKCLPL